jgi:hypothetical protein
MKPDADFLDKLADANDATADIIGGVNFGHGAPPELMAVMFRSAAHAQRKLAKDIRAGKVRGERISTDG